MSVTDELKGIVSLPSVMNDSLVGFARRLSVSIKDEQSKPNPNNALIALLCDAGRLALEHGKPQEIYAFHHSRIQAARAASVREGLEMAAEIAKEESKLCGHAETALNIFNNIRALIEAGGEEGGE